MRTKLITPLGPAEWTLTEHDDTVSLSPSFGNGPKSCRSRSEIANSTVQRLTPVSAAARQRTVQHDARELQAHLRRQNRWWRRLRRLGWDMGVGSTD